MTIILRQGTETMTGLPKGGSYEKGLPQMARESRDFVNVFKGSHYEKGAAPEQ
jgi:hypothetical protein